MKTESDFGLRVSKVMRLLEILGQTRAQTRKVMKHLRLPLLRSKTVIQTARRPLFTCELRRHTSSLEGRRPKSIQLTQQWEINLPAKPLANANIYWLLKPGTCFENELDASRVYFFDTLSIFRGQKSRLDMKMHRQSTSFLKLLVVQKCANGLKI